MPCVGLTAAATSDARVGCRLAGLGPVEREIPEPGEELLESERRPRGHLPAERLARKPHVDRAAEPEAEARGPEGQRVGVDLLPAARLRGLEHRQMRAEHLGHRLGERQRQRRDGRDAAAGGRIRDDPRPGPRDEPRDASRLRQPLPRPRGCCDRRGARGRGPRGHDPERNDASPAHFAMPGAADPDPGDRLGEANGDRAAALRPKHGRANLGNGRMDGECALDPAADEPADPARPSHVDRHRHALAGGKPRTRPDRVPAQDVRQRLPVGAGHRDVLDSAGETGQGDRGEPVRRRADGSGRPGQEGSRCTPGGNDDHSEHRQDPGTHHHNFSMSTLNAV